MRCRLNSPPRAWASPAEEIFVSVEVLVAVLGLVPAFAAASCTTATVGAHVDGSGAYIFMAYVVMAVRAHVDGSGVGCMRAAMFEIILDKNPQIDFWGIHTRGTERKHGNLRSTSSHSYLNSVYNYGPYSYGLYSYGLHGLEPVSDIVMAYIVMAYMDWSQYRI